MNRSQSYKRAKRRACEELDLPASATTKDILALAKQRYRVDYEIPAEKIIAIRLLTSVFSPFSKLRARI